MILILYILSIFGAAAGDGLHQSGRKFLAHPLRLLQPVSLLVLVILILIVRPDYDPYQLALIAYSYFILRFALFDYIRNLFAGKDIFYIGDTSYYDRFCQRIAPAMLNLIRVESGIVIIYCLISKLWPTDQKELQSQARTWQHGFQSPLFSSAR